MACSIALVAGEASGDMHGAHLAAAIARVRGDVRFWGAGGPAMRAEGIEIAANTTGGGTIGVAESLKTLPAMLVKYLRLRRAVIRRRPDLFVPVDFGAFNIPLARAAHRNGIEVVYYIPPSSWRRKPRNADRLKECGGKVVTPFAWSARLLSEAGLDARFVGHPLVDIVKPTVGRARFLRELEFTGAQPLVALLPGSRAHEVREHLTPMLDAAGIVYRELPGARFVVAAAWRAGEITRRIDAASKHAPGLPPVKVVERRAHDCMAHCDLLITASGTATLEAAILGAPMLIVYKGTSLMRLEYVFRRAVLEDHIGLPNIVADRRICPEIIGEQVTGGRLAEEALRLLSDADSLARMRSALAEVTTQLGEPGAIERAARAVLQMGGLESTH